TQHSDEKIIAKDVTIKLTTEAITNRKDAASNTIEPALTQASRKLFIPQSIDELNQVLAAYPNATIWAGGTDLGLSVTQHLVDHEVIVQLSAVEALKTWSLQDLHQHTDEKYRVNADKVNSEKVNSDKVNSEMKSAVPSLILGAGMSYQQLLPVLEEYFPSFAHLFERIASPQIRNMGTIGGNVANASPIGD